MRQGKTLAAYAQTVSAATQEATTPANRLLFANGHAFRGPRGNNPALHPSINSDSPVSRCILPHRLQNMNRARPIGRASLMRQPSETAWAVTYFLIAAEFRRVKPAQVALRHSVGTGPLSWCRRGRIINAESSNRIRTISEVGVDASSPVSRTRPSTSTNKRCGG